MPAHHYGFPFNSKPSDLNPKTSKTPTPASLEELIIAKEDTLVGRSRGGAKLKSYGGLSQHDMAFREAKLYQLTAR